MKVLLSVCIPVFNREDYLLETLNSLIPQVSDEVEVCISDNCSTDSTFSIIENARRQSPRVRVQRQATNVGADRNFMDVADMARGEYFVILGSDDLVQQNYVQEVLKLIKVHAPTILLCNRTTFERDLSTQKREYALRLPHKRLFRFGTDFKNYLNSAKSLCAIFSFLSTVIICRESWNSIPKSSLWIGSGYSHTHRLFGVLFKQTSESSILYCPKHLIICRLGNDSFRAQGLPNRVMLDLNAFLHISSEFDRRGLTDEATLILKLLKGEYGFWRLVRYQSLLIADPNWVRCLRTMINGRIYSSYAIFVTVILGSIPGFGRASFIFRDLVNRFLRRF